MARPESKAKAVLPQKPGPKQAGSEKTVKRYKAVSGPSYVAKTVKGR